MIKFVSIFVFAFLGLLTASEGKDVLRVRADSWCPYNCEPSSQKPGYMIEVLREIYEPLGTEIDYKLVTWSRAIVETRKGASDAIVGAAKNDAPDFRFPKMNLGKSSSCFFAKSESTWKYTGVESLKSIKLGAIQGYAYSSEVDPYIKSNARNEERIEWVTGDDAVSSNLKKLLRGRIDSFIEDRQVVQMLSTADHLDSKIKEVGCSSILEVYVAFGPSYPKANEKIVEFEEGLKRLRNQGRLNQILQRYGLQDWSSPQKMIVVRETAQ